MTSFPLRKRLELSGDCWWFAFSPANIKGATTKEDLETAGLTTYPCSVPGNFELDLQVAGLIEEPFFGMNIDALRKYESYHVWYGRDFVMPEYDESACKPVWTFEGIDCFSTVFLNGKTLGFTENMLIEHSMTGVRSRIVNGVNSLTVHIKPASAEAQLYRYSPGVSAFRQSVDSLYVRKAPHMYGWDIMPRALSAGIWRTVSVAFVPVQRIDFTYLETVSATEISAQLRLRYRAVLPGADFVRDRFTFRIDGSCGDSRFHHEELLVFSAGDVTLNLQNPNLWWPRGKGEAALYDVRITLLKNGEVLDATEFRHGIRTIELNRTSVTDMQGSGEFCFYVNGERLFVNGSNWVPADAYHSRDRSRIPGMLALAAESGCNMLRCWGGNVYEDDLFFDLCDELGILVWQDFAMACAVYPRDGAFANRIYAEALSVVRRLRQHACLALWAGDNECDQAYSWMKQGNPNHNTLTRKVLPELLRMEDGRRPYLPSSPYLDEVGYEKGNYYLPEDHLWGPRDYYKSSYYHNSLCHFASEIGYHGCPSPDSIRNFISPNKLWPPENNDEWTLHASSPIPEAHLYDHRIALMTNQIREMFGTVPENLEDYSFASQAVQAEAKKHFIELFRSTMWRRTGILWWNLIDGWPQFSDAVVDYYFTKKLAFHAITRVQQPVCVMLREPKDWRQEIVISNTSRANCEIEYTITDADSQETVARGAIAAPHDKVTVIGSIPYCAADKRFYLIEWSGASGLAGKNHYLAGSPAFDLDDYKRWWSMAF